MKIHYTIQLKDKVIIDDYWGIPVLGGILNIVEKDGYVTALKLTLENQPIEYAPQYQASNSKDIPATITRKDPLLPFVKYHLDTTMTFLESIYNFKLLTDEIHSEYLGETDIEESKILIKTFAITQENPIEFLDFSLLSQAIMTSNHHNAPSFETTLTRSARKAFSNHQYIDSFRYSFLLIESLYGNGQFKAASLKSALKNNLEFQTLLAYTLSNLSLSTDNNSDTDILISKHPTTDSIIDHIVEKRGFYFHGNIKRHDAWRPDEQNTAKTLSQITLSVAIGISIQASNKMFTEEIGTLHYENAKKIGAIIVYNVKFSFKHPDSIFTSESYIEIEKPGTKLTHKHAFSITQEFLSFFEKEYPTSDLYWAQCTIQNSPKKVFDLILYSDDKPS